MRYWQIFIFTVLPLCPPRSPLPPYDTSGIVSYLIVPVGGLLIGAWALYFAQHMR